MKIAVLNGSPKGNNSITLQTILYLEKKYPMHNFTVLNVAQKIKYYETHMDEAISILEESDLILFSYPVYTFIVPYQLHRFIELLKEHGVRIKGKYATQVSTSKHFYDVTAHKFIEDNCKDIGLKYIKGLSADMDDLLKENGQNDAIKFWEYVDFCVKNSIYDTLKDCSYLPKKGIYKPSLTKTPKIKGKKIVLVTDCEKTDINLNNMIDDFISVLNYEVTTVNIKDYPFSGGCLGCFNCAVNGKCIYKDGFDDYLRNNIQSADGLIYAFTIKDHSMGSRFKLYDDRQFCNGHRTVTMGMPIGYIISGEYSKESNLQMIIEGRSEVGHTFLSGIATDEDDTEKELKNLALKFSYALNNHVLLPQNFLGVGGMKIFRDLIYIMRGMMKADHKFYKKHGIYDFPQKEVGMILKMKLVGTIISIPSVKKKMGGKMNTFIIEPYKKVIESAK